MRTHLRFLLLLGGALALLPPRLTAAQPGDLTGLVRNPTNVVLSWQGRFPPYQIQTSSNLLDWSDQGDPTPGTNSVLAAAQSLAFYRVQHLNPSNLFGAFFGLIQTEQGEFGRILGRHRLKTRLWLYKTKGSPHTATTFLPANYWRKLLVSYQHHEAGAVRTWTGPLETLGSVATPGARRLTASWTRGTGLEFRSFLLTLDFPYDINVGRSIAVYPSDPTHTLKCTYNTAQPELNDWDMTLSYTNSDTIGLVQMDPANNPDDPDQSWWVRNFSVARNGARVNIRLYEGLPLYQGSPPWIFKTLLLDRWMSPSTGDGGSLPAFSTDSYFTRTYFPGHHNFYASVLIEPALEPALAESTRAALAAANIRYIYTLKSYDPGLNIDDIRYIGFNNTVRLP